MLISCDILLMYIVYNSELRLFRKDETHSVLYGNLCRISALSGLRNPQISILGDNSNCLKITKAVTQVPTQNS